jgi:hypothetical protein
VSKKETLGVLVALMAAVLGVMGVAAARAQPVQQVTVALKSAGPGGAVQLRIFYRFFDTTGAVPPQPTTFYARLPRGLMLRREFLNARYYCNAPALREALDLRPTGVSYAERVANLKPFIRSLAHSRSKSDQAALATARTCNRARVGGGMAEVDARTVSSVLAELIPARFSAFLSRPTLPGAVAGIVVTGSATAQTPIVRRFPVVADLHAIVMVNFFNDPTPDGRYGYRVALPNGPINGLKLSIAQANGTLNGITIPKGTCVRRGRGGRCTARRRTDLSLITLSRCPSVGLSGELFAGFAAPTPSITTTFQIPCPQFSP